MEKKQIEVTYECPKSDITSMTEAFFGLKTGTLSSKSEEDCDLCDQGNCSHDCHGESDRTARDYADAEPKGIVSPAFLRPNTKPHETFAPLIYCV